MDMKTLDYLLLLSAFLALGMTSCNTEIKTSDNSPSIEQDEPRLLRHVVLFKFKESATGEDIATVERAFHELPSKIPEIYSYEWGINNSPENLEKGFTHCFFLSFLSEDDRATYLPHPDHKAFGEVLTPFLEDVMVFDYWNK